MLKSESRSNIREDPGQTMLIKKEREAPFQPEPLKTLHPPLSYRPLRS